MNNNPSGGNNLNPTQSKSVLPYSPALSTTQQITEIFKSRFQQRRGKKDKDPHTVNQSQQLSNDDDDMDAGSSTTTPATISPTLEFTSLEDSDITDGKEIEANTNLDVSNVVSLHCEGTKVDTEGVTPSESSENSGDNIESDISDKNSDMVLETVSTGESVENENKTDDNETNDSNINNAKLLLQKLMEISESVDKLKSEKQLLAAMGKNSQHKNAF